MFLQASGSLCSDEAKTILTSFWKKHWLPEVSSQTDQSLTRQTDVSDVVITKQSSTAWSKSHVRGLELLSGDKVCKQHMAPALMESTHSLGEGGWACSQVTVGYTLKVQVPPVRGGEQNSDPSVYLELDY